MERLIYRWRRFWWTSSSLERGVLIGGSMLALIAAVVAVVTLSQGGGDGAEAPASVPQGPAPQVEVDEPMPSATALSPTVPLTATPQPVVVAPSPTPKPPPNREDCDAIRGTSYLSSAEREWFLDQCLDRAAPAEPAADSSPPLPGADSDGGGPPSGPTAPPPPSPDAGPSPIALAVEWMTNEAPLAYIVSEELCSATQVGTHWVVSCPATVQGCQGSACRTTLWVCVFQETQTVVPSESC